MLFLILLYTFICQIFHLCIERPMILFRDIADFIQQFALKANPCLHFLRWHDNTSLLFCNYFIIKCLENILT